MNKMSRISGYPVHPVIPSDDQCRLTDGLVSAVAGSHVGYDALNLAAKRKVPDWDLA